MTLTRLTPLLPTLFLFFIACNTGAPEQDVLEEEIMTGDTVGDAHLDTADALVTDILPADILEVAEDLPQDLPEDLPEEILEEILEVILTEVVSPCESHVECDDGNECTLDSCKPATGCEHIEILDCCQPEVIELWDMEADIAGLEVTNLEPEDSAAVFWQLSSERAWSGSQSLYFGDPATLSYDSGHRVRASALLPAVTVPVGFDVELRMMVWLDVEDGFDWDAFTVYVNGGDLRVPILVKTYQTKYEEWQEWVVLLNAFGDKDIQIEFFFDSVDTGGNSGEGIYVDDVRVAARCPIPETCYVAVDCNDQALCTTDSCEGGQCVYEVNSICCLSQAHCLNGDPCSIDFCNDDWSCSTATVEPPFCCYTDSDCEDGNVCTDDECYEGACFHPPSDAPGCCEEDSDCDDDSSCTIDKCEDATCVNINICCYSDEECDDGDDVCTIDMCIDYKCKFIPTGEPGCCTEEMLLDTFDTTDATTDWMLGPPGGSNVGWHIWGTPPTGDGGSALYYGNPSSGNFDSGGVNMGEAISPEILLQPGVNNSLTFHYFQDSEGGTYYDMCWLYISWFENSDTWVEIWSKDQYTSFINTWHTYTVNLNGLGGETVRFRWYFHTTDSALNDGIGVLVDDFNVQSTCLPVDCQSDFECADDLPGTNGICIDQNACAFEVLDEVCATDTDCDDGNQCTVDTCQSQLCSHAPAENCCFDDTECNDDNVCTTDICAPGSSAPTCQNPWAPGCCITADDCNDGNACTDDICPGEGEQCQNPAIEGCCLTDGECADEDVCTIDTCTANVCVHTPAEECCYEDVTCDDDNPCSAEYCDLEAMPNAICVYEWIPDCCFVYEDCEDGNPCTEDVCPAYGELCTNEWIDGCCLNNSDCADANDCTWDLCFYNVCAYVNLCCTLDEECDDGDDICTTDACVEGACVFTATGVDGCCFYPLFRDDFSGDLGWEYDANWQRGEATASSGSVNNDDPANDHSTSADDFIAGVIIGGMAPTSLGGFYWLTSPEIDISQAAAPHISYWRWLNSDYMPYMQNKVEVYNGSTWVNLWTTGNSPGIQDSSWTHHDYDVTPHKNAAFRIRIGYIISSGGVYTISSWNLDDVQVYDAAPLAANANLCCIEPSDCQGIVPGTECLAGECQ